MLYSLLHLCGVDLKISVAYKFHSFRTQFSALILGIRFQKKKFP